MTELERKLGYEFQNKGLLKTALTHSSYANERKKSGIACNERLEFLGDSVLGLVVAEHLFKRYADMPEGDMTKLRAELVCEQSLVGVAKQLSLGESLLLGRGEEQGGGRKRHSILADATEAVLAAVYLDGGLKAVTEIIEKYVLAAVDTGTQLQNRDYKTALQELVQKKSGQELAYHLLEESGPDHDKVFTAEVCLNGRRVGMGSGRNKKEAEQAAAHVALEALSR